MLSEPMLLCRACVTTAEHHNRLLHSHAIFRSKDAKQIVKACTALSGYR